jgi:hypothetical protein
LTIGKEATVRLRRDLLALALVLFVPAASHAQDFGVMNSAETIDRGNTKLTAWPLLIFGDDGGDNDGGFVFGAGYGLTPNLDVEGRLAVFDGITFIGGDVEYWLMRDRPWDLSIGAGFHVGQGDSDAGVLDRNGFDVTVLGSGHVSERLEFFGALDLAFESLDVAGDDDLTTAHLVPGIEYRLNENLDFVGELGVGLNDDSGNYIAAGIAYYIR